jgi:serine/threonine protein kinase
MEGAMAATELTSGTALGEDGRYRLERLLGTGGMASVWLATDVRLGRDVAAKVLADSLALDPDYVSRFEREALVAAALSHPNLVNVFDFNAGPPRPYLVMEYVPGTTLADRLRSGDELDPEIVLRELLNALAHIHQAGILHRDIKPGNVLIGADGRARLTDFGVAQLSGAARLTSTGLVVGTARYIAPEVLRGGQASERSDLYSCGVLLRDCLHGGGPWPLRALADRLTDERPARRPASAAEAIKLLDQTRTQPRRLPPSASVFRTHTPHISRAGREIQVRVTRSSAVATAVLLVLVVALIGLAASGSGGSERSSSTRGGLPSGLHRSSSARRGPARGPHRGSPPPVAPPAVAPLASQLDYLDRVIGQARR